MTTRNEIRSWVQSGIDRGHKWMIVKSDWFDHDDYPVYADTPEEFWEIHDKTDDRIMEAYDLSADVEEQIAAARVFRSPLRPNPSRLSCHNCGKSLLDHAAATQVQEMHIQGHLDGGREFVDEQKEICGDIVRTYCSNCGEKIDLSC